MTGGEELERIRFSPMTEAEFVAFRAYDISHNDVQVGMGYWTADEAPRRAQEEFDQLLPNGKDSPGHFLNTVFTEPGGQPIGSVWYAVEHRPSFDVLYVHWVGIYAAARGRGYTIPIAEKLESEARRLGVRRLIGLVWGDNPRIKAAASRAGFRVTSAIFEKEIIPDGRAPTPK
jgi:RimJ/RimL family protein N-acetyltransferase